ncbi:MAG: PTS transporter subunit EIIC [Betaproteobacteria bacterium]|nr:PTS transporter subunit EIIC [Betaproteobacteria bacterium]
MTRALEATQQLGRALMLPIAVLPIAGLLLRLGQPDLLNLAPVAAAGDAIFSSLGLLFAIGVAVGLARENHGAAGLAAAVCYVVAAKGAEVLIQVPPDIFAKGDLAAAAHKARQLSKISVPIGLLSGLLSGWLYNRYSEIKLPNYLAFFAGRRFVPIAAGCAGLGLAAAFGLGWGTLEVGMDALSRAVVGAGEFGLFVYGVLNRLLIVTGLHHILNNLAWFLVGDFNGATGDLKRFFAGDPAAGVFMSGFFPVMMFGLPAACLAMYHTANKERRAATGGLLLSMGLTSFLTGVTEPIEFTFMFLAPLLYAVHAVLTGLAMVTMDLLGIRLGFGFSAGLFDYALNFKLSTRPWLMLPVGAVYAVLYYVLFRWCIVRFNLATPGREADTANAAPTAVPAGDAERARGFIAALGGAANLRQVDACTTRLRLVLADRERIDAAALTSLGARGTVKLGHDALQVVIGPIADQVAGDIRKALAAAPAALPPLQDSAATAQEMRTASAPIDPETRALAAKVVAALGGAANVVDISAIHGRVRLRIEADARADAAALGALGLRAVLRPDAGVVHLLHADAEALSAAIQLAVTA